MNRLRRLPSTKLTPALAITLVAGASLAGAIAGPAQAAAPLNDRPADAAVATGIGYTDTVDVSRATAGTRDPRGCVNNASVWYTFTPDADSTVNVNTTGSNYHTTIGVYTGTPGALTKLKCADWTAYRQSALNLKAQADTTYYFMIGAYAWPHRGRDGSDFDKPLHLQFHMLTPLAVDVAQPATDARVDAADGDAHIAFTTKCNYEADGRAHVALRQRVDAFGLAKGDRWAKAPCGTQETSTTVKIAPEGDVAFVEGPATATTALRVCSRTTGTCMQTPAVATDLALTYPAPAP